MQTRRKKTDRNHNKHSGRVLLLHVLAEDCMEKVFDFRLLEERKKSLKEKKPLKHTLAQRKS
jgi:hypothetical protein